MTESFGKPINVVIDNHIGCQLVCAHCWGPRASERRPPLRTPEELPNLISFDEFREAITAIHRRLGDKITYITFGGNWCEPTLDQSLKQKIDFLLKETGFRVVVITNGVNIPQGEYDLEKMKNYFLSNFGFPVPPERFSLIMSVDDEHLSSYQKKRQAESGLCEEDAEIEYLSKIANLVRYAEENGIVERICFNTVKPEDLTDEETFIRRVRDRFGIPDSFKIGVLRRSIYAKRQEGLSNAVVINGTDSPHNKAFCYFLTKRGGKLWVHCGISDFGHKRNPKSVEDFIEELSQT